MKRREFITLLGGAAVAWPNQARTQQPALPVVGYLSASTGPDFLSGFRQGLKEAGYVEGQNVTIEYHGADGQYDRLPAMAADLVRRRVSVIAANGPAILAAKGATATIPIVFITGDDPVQFGLVASLNRPGGNLTGITNLNVELGPKRLELARELAPAATLFAVLVNPANQRVDTQAKDFQAVAQTLGLQLNVLRASAESEFDAAFATVVQSRAGALVIGADPFFTSRSKQLAALAVRRAVPSIFQTREFAAAGGLMSYGGNGTESARLAGVYTGRILKGEKPADLPVQQATKVELVINLKSAKALGLSVPLALLTRADEVIE